MNSRLLATIALAGAALLPIACSTTPESEPDRAELASDVSIALDRFRAADPGIQDLLDRSPGYAVLPNVGKGALGVGAAYGKGEVFEKGVKIGYCDMTQGSIGFQAGGQAFSELIIFTQQSTLDEFKTGDFTFSANASAVAARAGAAAASDTSSGTVVFFTDPRGLMAEASVSGQKFRFRPLSSSY